MKFYKLNQNGIVKLETDTSNEIEGVYTEGIESCLICCFSNGKGTHLVAHIMDRSDTTTLSNEIGWMKSKDPTQTKFYVNIAYNSGFFHNDFTKKAFKLYSDCYNNPAESDPNKKAFSKQQFDKIKTERKNEVIDKVNTILDSIEKEYNIEFIPGLVPTNNVFSISRADLNVRYPKFDHEDPDEFLNDYADINKAAIIINACFYEKYPLNIEFDGYHDHRVDLLPDSMNVYQKIKPLLLESNLVKIKADVANECPQFLSNDSMLTQLSKAIFNFSVEELDLLALEENTSSKEELKQEVLPENTILHKEKPVPVNPFMHKNKVEQQGKSVEIAAKIAIENADKIDKILAENDSSINDKNTPLLGRRKSNE